MKRIHIDIDPKEDGSIEVSVSAMYEINQDDNGGSYKVTKVVAPVPIKRGKDENQDKDV